MKNLNKRRIWTSLFILSLSLTLLNSGLYGQYFGRNKVQYQKFDFKILKTKHFDIYYYPEIEPHLEKIASYAENFFGL